MPKPFKRWFWVGAYEDQAVLAQSLQFDLAGEKQLIDLVIGLDVETGE